MLHKTIIPLLTGVLLTLQLTAQNNLEFIENKGQWHKDVLYKGNLNNGAFFLRTTGFTVLQHNPDDLVKIADRLHGHLQTADDKTSSSALKRFKQRIPETDKTGNDTIIHSHAYRMDFVGANPGIKQVGEKPEQDYVNYFIGDDPSKWASNCRNYQQVVYRNVYPGIDVKYYTEAGNLKYEFIVNPGADPSQIAMKFDGIDKLNIRNND